jgi:glycosyltransferase involved in cell wall biosynthesis
MSVTLLLPVLNEIEAFRLLLPKLDRSLFDEILVVDGRSTDGTVEYALEQGLTVMTQLRKGLQFALIDSLEHVHTDYVVEFSMDGNCELQHLPALLAKMNEGYDLVIVSRYLPPAKSQDDNIITAFGNWMFSVMMSCLGPTRITDSLGIYRGFKTSLVKSEEFKALVLGPVYEPLTSAYANLKRMRITEIPGDEPLRVGGVSKMSVWYNGSYILWMVFRCYLIRFGLWRVQQ